MVVFPELDPFAYAYEASRPTTPRARRLRRLDRGPTARSTTQDPNKGRIVFTGDVTLRVGDHTFNCLHTPGHTPGQLAVHVPEEGVVFTGDTIFSGCQTWLMTSDVDQWLAALDRIRPLDFDRIVPGHGPVVEVVPRRAALGAARRGSPPSPTPIAKGWSRDETIARVNFEDEFGPVDIGQGYMLDYIQSRNAAALYDKLTGTTPQLTAPERSPEGQTPTRLELGDRGAAREPGELRVEHEPRAPVLVGDAPVAEAGHEVDERVDGVAFPAVDHGLDRRREPGRLLGHVAQHPEQPLVAGVEDRVVGQDQPACEQHHVGRGDGSDEGVARAVALAEQPLPVLELRVERPDPVVAALDRVAGGGPDGRPPARRPATRPCPRRRTRTAPVSVPCAATSRMNPTDVYLQSTYPPSYGRALEVELGRVAGREPAIPLGIRDDDQQVHVRGRRSRTRGRSSRRRARRARRRGPAAWPRPGRWSRDGARYVASRPARLDLLGACPAGEQDQVLVELEPRAVVAVDARRRDVLAVPGQSPARSRGRGARVAPESRDAASSGAEPRGRLRVSSAASRSSTARVVRRRPSGR